MEIEGQPLYCPRCGFANPADASHCTTCAQDLRLVAAAVRRHGAPPGNASGWRRFLPRRGLLVGVGAVALLALAITGWQLTALRQARARTEAQTAHYLNGVWASEVGRWDLAVAEFAAAGNHRDAPQRLAEAEARLSQVEERYTQARESLSRGDDWGAAYALHQVVSALPRFRDAAALLTETRAALGPLLIFEQRNSGPSRVVLSSADGGAQQQVAEATLAASGEFASDGRALMVETVQDGKNDLWLIQPPATAEGEIERQLLVAGAKDVWGRFSPDGRWLLYGWWGERGWQLATIPAVGGEATELLRRADFVSGGFSPESTALNYWAREGGAWRLGLSRPAAARPTDLVSDADEFGTLEWSPDGRMIAFGYARAGRYHLEIATVDGSRRYEPAPEAEYAWVRFSPDGEHLLLWSWREHIGRLTLTDLHGRPIREIVSGAADAWGEWGPNGREFVYGSWNGKTWQVTLEATAGGAPVPLAVEVEDAQATFAPKGRWLLLSIWQDSQWQLVLRDLTDNSERVLVGNAEFASALFAPDNEHVLIWYIPAGESGATLAIAEAKSGRRIALAQGLLAAQGGFARNGKTLGVALQPASGARASISVASADGTSIVEFAPAGYRLYWARTPFQFGPRPPGPPG